MGEWMQGSFDWLDRVRTRVKRRALHEHYRSVFDSPSGRIVLNDLVMKAGVMMTHEGWTPDQLQYKTGDRDRVLYILGMLRIEPPALQQLAEREVFDE